MKSTWLPTIIGKSKKVFFWSVKGACLEEVTRMEGEIVINTGERGVDQGGGASYPHIYDEHFLNSRWNN